MANELNSGSLEKLETGQVLLLGAVQTTTDKVQLEFAEKIGQETNLLGMFNASDDRFSSGARRVWMTAEIADAEAKLGLAAGTISGIKAETMDNGKECHYLNILNPKIQIGGVDKALAIQIVETTTPKDEYDRDHVETRAKRAGSDGPIMRHNGQPIFSYTQLVPVDILENGNHAPVQHTLLTADVATEEVVEGQKVIN